MSELIVERTESQRSRLAAVSSLLKAGIACIGLLSLGLSASAQTFVTPGPNANLIGDTPNANLTTNIADFGLKQQQEPSCVIRPSNAAYIMCAYNDLRASDKPLIQGDSWIGYSESGDLGNTWNSYLVPGYKSHPTNSLPNVGFAADPSLVSIPGSYAVPGDPSSIDSPGLTILNYIGANRDSNVGVLVIQRFVDNAQEDERHNLPENAHYIVADGSSGRFIDKPALLFVPDKLASQSYVQESISVEGRGEPVTVRAASGALVVAYAVFTGNDNDGGNSTKLYIQISRDNGKTFTNPTKLSESLNEVTGVSLSAIDQKVAVTWRQKADTNNPDAVLSVVSKNNNLTAWTKPKQVFELCPIDQPATGVSFRSFAFPWTANDGMRFWTFAADRRLAADGSPITSCDAVPGFPDVYDGIPRIVGMSSTDGINWFGDAANPGIPFIVDASTDSSGKPVGFQIMPSVTGIKNRLDLVWYDTRREEQGAGLPLQGAPGDPQIPLIYDYSSTDSPVPSLARVLRKADVWMTRLRANCPANGGCTPNIETPVRVSQYSVALIDDTDPEGYALPFETEAHLPNHKLYASGTLAFKGDYIAIAAPQLRKTLNGAWLNNSKPQQSGVDLPTFNLLQDVFVAWGDNRDVRIDYDYLAAAGDPEQVPYTPPGGPGQSASAFQLGEIKEGASEPLVPIDAELKSVTESDDSEDPGTPADDSIVSCTATSDFSRSRDSNIYGSLVADSPSLVALTNTKPLGTIQRMFPLVLSNPSTTSSQDFCLVIANQPAGAPAAARASFFQLPAIPPFPDNPPPLTRLPVTVDPGSSESRAIFLFADPTDVVRVDAYLDEPGGEECEDDLASDTFNGTLQNSIFVSDGALFDSGYCEANPTVPACQPTSIEETHNISLASLNLQAPVLKASVSRALNLQALNLQAPALGALNLQALNLQALPPAEYEAILAALNLQALNLQALNLQALNLQALNLQALNLQALNLQALNLQAPNLQALNLQALNLQALNLQALNLQAPSLGDGSDPTSPTAQLEQAVVNDDVYYQDITYIVNTDANVTTTYSADIALDVNSLKAVPEDEDPVVQLIAWTPNSVNSASQGACGQPQTGFQAQVLAFTTLDALNLQAVNLPTTINPDNQNPYAGEISFTGKPNQKIAITARIWATGGTKLKLEQEFGEWVACMNTPEAENDPEFCSNAGVGQLISFGASSQSCATSDKIDPVTGEPLYDPSDCLNNDNEKIFQDRQPPTVNPVNPPDGFDPPTLPYNLDPALNTLTVTWPVEGTDTDAGSVIFECTIDGVPGFFPDTQSVNGNEFSATFSYDFPVGSTPVSCDVTDGNGNTATVTFNVEVFDVTDPVFTFVPPAITVDAAGPSGTSVTLDTATATDAFAVTITNDAPALFPLGETTVTWTAIDANGRFATATTVVTVEDSTPPVFTFVPPDQSEEAAGPSGTAVALGTPTATDAFGVTISDDAPALFPLGATTVTWTATDANGNVATATTVVTVADNTEPVFTFVPPASSFEAAGPAGTAVPLGTATATDAFGVTITSDAPSLFPLGETTVTWTATDANGNIVTATTVVTVADNLDPVFTFVPPAISFEAAGPGGTDVPLGTATAADAFGVIITSDAPALFPLGTTTVTWTATDANGNIVTATTVVMVADNTDPEFSFVPPDQTVNATGSSGTAVDVGTATATDAFAVTVTNDAPALFPLGTTTVTWTATDANGNVATATTVITVVDGSGPTVTAPDVELSVDFVNPLDPDWGSVPESVYAANVTATDAVDGAITDISCIRDVPSADPLLGDTDFEFSDTPYSITCTAEDTSGNVGTASFLLTVRYLYDINLELPKGRARAGSTIPIDFAYSEWVGGAPVDSSAVPVRVSWSKMTDSSCTTVDNSVPEESSGLGEDSGNSDFRYSFSSDEWQFSWQTPPVLGYFRLAISPPGKFVDNAVACVRLR